MAVADLTRILARSGDEPEPRDFYHRGLSHQELGHPDLAVQDFTSCIQTAIVGIHPSLFLSFLHRGLAHESLEEYQLAVQDYTRAGDLQPDDHRPYAYRGILRKDLRLFDLALADYSHAIELNPQALTSFRLRGELLVLLNRYDDGQALADFSTVINETTMSDARAWCLLFRCFVECHLGFFSQAREDLRLSFVLDSGFAGFHLSRGEIPHLETDFRRFLAQVPGLGQGESESENESGSAEAAESLILNFPAERCYFAQQFAQAIDEYTLLLSHSHSHSDDSIHYLRRGHCYEEEGQTDLALADYNTCLDLDPSNFDAVYRRGTLHYRLKRYDLAIQDYTLAIELDDDPDSDSFRPRCHRGIVYRLLGKNELALGDYSAAIAIKPEDENARILRGDILILLERWELAIQDWSTAIQLTRNIFQTDTEPSSCSASVPTWLSWSLRNRAFCRCHLGDFDGASKDIQESYEVNPSFPCLESDLHGITRYGPEWREFIPKLQQGEATAELSRVVEKYFEELSRGKEC